MRSSCPWTPRTRSTCSSTPTRTLPSAESTRWPPALASPYTHNLPRRRLGAVSVTLLFTDIEASTRLVQELGDGWADALAEHRRHVREVLADRAGEEIDCRGD